MEGGRGKGEGRRGNRCASSERAACRRLHGGVTAWSFITRSAWSAAFSASSSSRTAWRWFAV